jgi:polar amino acid transport system substrate-binding protein
MNCTLVKRIAILLVAAGLACSAPATADSERSPTLTRIVEAGQLRVGMSGDQAPLNFRGRSGKMLGLEVELSEALATSMGVELEIVTKPFAELLPALEGGDVDLVISGMTITPERNLRAAFVGPYFVSGKSILTKSEVLARANEASDLDETSLKLVALRASTSETFVKVFLPQAQLTSTEDYASAVSMIVQDEADALVADFPVCLLSILRYPDAGLTALNRPLTLEPIGIALAPDDPLLLNLVENYLATLRGTGLLELLRKRWFESSAWLAELP